MRAGPARLAATSGAATAGLSLASLALLPASSGADRAATLVATFVAGLAWSGAFLVFLAALHHLLRARQDETTALLAGVGFAGGLVNAAVIVLCTFLLALAAFRPREPEQLALLQDAAFLANSFTGYATAVCVTGFSLALRRLGFPLGLVALGAAVALHHLVSAASLAAEGPWSPFGAVSGSAPLGMTLWVVGVAALVWRRRERL